MSSKVFSPTYSFQIEFFLNWKGEILEMCLCGDLHMFIQNRVFCITMLPRNRFSSVCKPEKNHATLFYFGHLFNSSWGTMSVCTNLWVSQSRTDISEWLIFVKYSFTKHIVKNAWDFFINCVITCVICFPCLTVYNNFSSICSTCSRIASTNHMVVGRHLH